MSEFEQALLQGLNMRLALAHENFDRLNELAGEERYEPPPMWDLRAALLAMGEVLSEAGLTTDELLAIRTARIQVEHLEQALTEAQADLRKNHGIDAPLGFSTRPQG